MSNPIVYIVQERANPSTDFFVLPAVATNHQQVICCNFNERPDPDNLIGATVIFVRYVPPAWATLVTLMRAKLHKLIFFIDDDVLDLNAAAGTPWRYRFKLARLAAWRYRWLKQQQAELWVSTPYLQQKYAAWPAKLVLPSPVSTPAQMCRVFYHGSASHDADIRWLRPVMAEALQRNEQLVFEIIGGQAIYRLYKNLPRINVIHPMQWPSYQAFLAMQQRHIGLNPLLPSSFNKARSYSKFFDITRCDAVGIYSPGSACAEIVSHEQDGLIIGLDQEAWATAIVQLAQNPSWRQTLLHNAKAKLQLLAEQAQSSYADLLL